MLGLDIITRYWRKKKTPEPIIDPSHLIAQYIKDRCEWAQFEIERDHKITERKANRKAFAAIRERINRNRVR